MLRVMTWNICHANYDKMDRTTEIVKVIHSQRPSGSTPYVVALQEAPVWGKFKPLADELGMPFRFGAAKEGYALAILTTSPTAHVTTLHPHGITKPVVEITVSYGNHLLYFFTVHLKAHGGANPTGIDNLLDEPELKKGPHVLLGDFNALEEGINPRSPSQRPHVVVTQVQGRDYIDCYRAFHTDATANPGFTYSTHSPAVRYDYIFTSPGFPLRLSSCRVVTEAGAASDHFPVIADFE